MNKIWLQNYPQGIPAEVDVAQYRSLKEILEISCQRFAALPAFTNMGTSITYADLDRLTRQFGAYLQHQVGLAKGARVAIMLPNLLQYPVALFGALRAGMTVVNVNPLYTASELRHQLRDSGAETVVVLENFARTLQEAIPDTGSGVMTISRCFGRPRRSLPTPSLASEARPTGRCCRSASPTRIGWKRWVPWPAASRTSSITSSA